MDKSCVYILKSKKDGKHYIGCTSNLNDRLNRHDAGENISTRYRGELELLYYETFYTLAEASKREKYIKDLGIKRFFQKVEN